MNLTLTHDEYKLLVGILEQHHRELLREIARTDHHEFRRSLHQDEQRLESILRRLREACVEEVCT